MSLYGAMDIGVAGLSAASQSLSVTSSNIANVNTIGYKEATATFATYLDSSLGTSGDASAGVTTVIGQDVTAQGLTTTTSSPTDLSISGKGFFIVTPSGTATGPQQYTQVGNFNGDSKGNLVNANGEYLLGWKLDSAGNPPSSNTDLSLINVSGLSGSAVATANVSMQANLQSNSTVDGGYVAGDMTAARVTPDFQTTINVYDSQGGTQPLTLSFIETGTNKWAYEVAYAGSASNLSSANPIAEGTMTFNSDGSLATPASAVAVAIPWSASSGLAAQTVNFNLGTAGKTNGFTQFNASSAVSGQTVDGSPFGSVTGVSVGTDGTVTAKFSNGISENVYKIPIATFADPDGLQQLTGNAYTSTNASGVANINAAGTGGAGAVTSSSLEDSTVDLSTEFTHLITAQNAYSAAARIITTTNQMLQALEQIPA
ncbi:MAG: flagellar hook protein FlgE [Rhizomicrobium sp.]